MSPVEQHLAAAVALAAPALLLQSAALLLLARNRKWCGLVGWLAVAPPVAGVLLSHTAWADRLPPDLSLFSWSPLGLYGVQLALRVHSDTLLLQLPAALLAAAGLTASTQRRRAARRDLSAAAALCAVAGALSACVAGDLVSLFLAIGWFALGTAAVLWTVAGERPAARQVVLVGAGVVGMLVCVLVVGKVNGLFGLAELSTAGVTTPVFLGLLLVACIVAPVPPVHGWLLRAARQPLAPALCVAGSAVALSLFLLLYQVTAGQLSPTWQRTLGALGWIAALAGAGTALGRRSPALRFAAVAVGRGAQTLLAASVATPAALAAGMLYLLLVLPVMATLWLATTRPSQVAAPAPARGAPARRPGFWLYLVLLAAAAGLPGTITGLARGALVGALTAWPSGDQLHRFPVLVLDTATLIAGGAVLWRRAWFVSLRGRAGWALVALVCVLLVAPTFVARVAVETWFGPAAAQATGTSSMPLALSDARIPTVFSALLTMVALWALAQSLRGREWLPAPARLLAGAAILAWLAVGRRLRIGRWSAVFARTGEGVRLRIGYAADRLMALIRPMEERYYAAVAVMLAVAIIYVIGR